MSDQHAKLGGVEDWKGEEFELQDEDDYRVTTNLARSSGGDNRATPPGRKDDDNEENDDDETEIQTGNGEQSCGIGATDKIGTPGATNENEELTVDERFGQSSGGELRLPELSGWRTPRNSVRWNISGEPRGGLWFSTMENFDASGLWNPRDVSGNDEETGVDGSQV